MSCPFQAPANHKSEL